MKLLTFIFLIVLTNWMMIEDPKPVTTVIVEQSHLDSLESLISDIQKSNRITLPIAIKCNAEHKR
jgi:hypothetical protein